MNAIEIKNMTKVFRIPHKKKTTVFETITTLGEKRTYETIYALKDINLNVGRGETLGVIGLNGSGKTTLLRLIGGIINPSRGTIKVSGKISPFLELGVGFQTDLTARENIYLYGAVMGLSRKEIDKKFENIIRFSGLGKFVDTELKNFSSGMHVRLGFSTAIETEGDVYLVDEVLAVGDAKFQKKCLNVFNKIKRGGKTIVFVSHDLGAIKRVCDRAIFLDNGKIKQEGKPEEVVKSYERSLSGRRRDESAEGRLLRELGEKDKAIKRLSGGIQKEREGLLETIKQKDDALSKVNKKWVKKLQKKKNELKEHDEEWRKIDRRWEQKCRRLSQKIMRLGQELGEKDKTIKGLDSVQKEKEELMKTIKKRDNDLNETEKKLKQRHRDLEQEKEKWLKIDKRWEQKYQMLSQKMIRLKVIEDDERKREGSGEVEITRVELIDGTGKRKKTFRTGDTFIVKISYDAKKKIKNPVFGIGIHRYDNVHITGPNTKSHNFTIKRIEGKGIVEYSVKNLPLLRGRYLLSVSVHPYNAYKPFDYHNKMYKFEVVENKVKDFGMFYIPSKWKIKQK